MGYNDLETFLLRKMRMSHIYQPVMIKHLLEHGGVASDKEIAQALLKYDPSQLEYYQDITNKMVGKVLRNHKVVDKNKDEYRLTAYGTLKKEEIYELIQICDLKLKEYIYKRGERIWQHRKKNRGYISGTIRYDVLRRACFRCELCGISADEKALEVDHITPLNAGGEDSIHNYQALCYSCNAMKRDRDNTDFRNNKLIYDHREEQCIFCTLDRSRIIEENNLAFLIMDQYPVTHLHSLVIPKRHSTDYFQINQAEINAINHLVVYGKELIQKKDCAVKGFNIGLNCGEFAGQTIMHTHLHLIPRREGDVFRPRGGDRNIIPGKGDY